MIMRLLFYKHIYKEYISLDTLHVLKNLTTCIEHTHTRQKTVIRTLSALKMQKCQGKKGSNKGRVPCKNTKVVLAYCHL